MNGTVANMRQSNLPSAFQCTMLGSNKSLIQLPLSRNSRMPQPPTLWRPTPFLKSPYRLCSVANGVFPFLCRIHFIDGASSVDTTSCYSYPVTASLWSPYLKPPLYLPSLWRQSTVASQRNSIPSHPGTLSIPLHHLFSCSTSLHVANLRARERWKNQGRTANCLDPQARKFLGWTWSLA